MSKEDPKLSKIAKDIRDVLIKHPDGLNIHQIRTRIGISADTQQHLDRRLRSLDPFYRIARRKAGRATVYVFKGERPEGAWDFSVISKDDRAKVLNRSGRRCQMCGRTVEDDCVKLHIDHKIPQSWGGTSEIENLWALCSHCNEGKKNDFKTLINGNYYN